MTLEEFLNSAYHNTWLEEPGIAIYVRRAAHVIEGQAVRCFDIANVEVQEALRGKGLFKVWLAKAEDLCPLDYVYVENVLNEFLAAYLVRADYKQEGQSYYKRLR